MHHTSRTFTAVGWLAVTLASVALVWLVPPVHAQSSQDVSVVQGLFFFSPSCGHCEYVITEVLPGVYEEYGGAPEVLVDPTLASEDLVFYEMTNGSLELLFVDVTTAEGTAMYLADIERLGIPDNRTGVPRLSVGDTYYVGSQEIPNALPGLIDDALADGRVPYPDIEGLDEVLAAMPGTAEDFGTTTTSVSAAASTTTLGETDGILPGTGDESLSDRFAADPLGNSISVLVLLGMVGSLVAIVLLIRKGRRWSAPSWVLLVLAVFGMAVAAYLGIVEASGSDAVCGPVGDCNAVQQSEWAELFGIPIGILGVIGYGGVLIAWLLARLARGRTAEVGLVGIAAIAFGGTLFSMYLTFLEPFVIGATCMWCITSAFTITGLVWVASSDGWEAMQRLRGTAS